MNKIEVRAMRIAVMVVMLAVGVGVQAETVVRVADDAGLARALAAAEAGTRIVMAPGRYSGGIRVAGVSGTAAARIVLEGAGARDAVVIGGSRTGIQLSDCNYVTLRNFTVRKCSMNGINLDDGGTYETPAKGLVVENVVVEAIGPKGNWDGLKMSGLVDFVVRGCRFSGWGGSAIDMVGCRNGVVEKVALVGAVGYSQMTGVQMKGGTERVVVKDSFFREAGTRAINLGGSTGLPYFRPRVGDFEAREIEVTNNRFVGGMAAVAFVTADGGEVHRNTFYLPGKWVFRILQETRDGRFVACRNGAFHHNLIVYDRRLQTVVNIGPGTAPETFRVAQNAWFAVDGTRLRCAVKQTGAVVGVDPALAEAGTAKMTIGSEDARLEGIGAR